MFRCILLIGVLVCVFAVGCSDDEVALFPVTGKVLFEDGSHAQFGTIECRSASSPPILARSDIKKDGTFELKTRGRKGLAAGIHHIVIFQVIPRSKRNIVHNHGLEAAKKYGSYETSKLEIEVKPEAENHFEFTIEARQ